MPLLERPVLAQLRRGLDRTPQLIHILTGPRQVGKTTTAHQVMASWSGPTRYAAADVPLPPDASWIEHQWTLARGDAAGGQSLLVLDEVQKVVGWREAVKSLWDEDRASGVDVRVIILGSSALLLAKGATESLAGRFFLHTCTHWTWPECREQFGWDLDRWLYYGGYPGAAPLVDEPETWKRYVIDSLIEAVLARDVLSLHVVNKPALLRHLFAFSAAFPAEIVSYTKMLGQLQDAGNTTTLAHYLRLLETAFLVSGLERHSPGMVRTRGSSPKLLVWNNALVNALGRTSYEATRGDTARWGRLVENAVGAHLVNNLRGPQWEVRYWRDRIAEVDFVVQTPDATWAIEVKSGRPRGAARGLTAFLRGHPSARPIIVGSGGMPLEEFFTRAPADVLG